MPPRANDPTTDEPRVVLDSESVRKFVLAEEYEHTGSRLRSQRQRAILLALGEERQVLFAAAALGLTLDIVGGVEIQSVGNEDRLLFLGNRTHLHVQWDRILEARKVVHRSWNGITFHDGDGAEVFGYWLAKPTDFSAEVHALLGPLVEGA